MIFFKINKIRNKFNYSNSNFIKINKKLINMRRNFNDYSSEESFDFDALRIQDRVYRNVTQASLKNFKRSYKKSEKIKTS